MNASLARLLKDFSEPVAPTPDEMSFDLDVMSAPDALDFPETDLPPPVDVEAERREAFEDGQAAAREQLLAEFGEEREALLATHQAEMAALQERLHGEMASLLLAKIEQAAGEIAAVLSDQLASVIAPLLSEAVTTAGVSELSEMIRAAIADGEFGRITVKGPASLLERITTELGDKAEKIHLVEDQSLDLKVDIDGSLMTTKLEAWADGLRRAIA
ncbi:hypothetical protein [Rhizobium sp. PAMB 3182]